MEGDVILTPEQIYDVDTLTLEEKIEQLQNHPNNLYYREILQLAQFELFERQKVEAWASQIICQDI